MRDYLQDCPTANLIYLRSYRRNQEDWAETTNRCVTGLAKVGKFTPEETELVHHYMMAVKSLPSGRWLWVGGTPWVEQAENYPGSYNCSSTNIVDWEAFGLMMSLAMMGCGTGAVIEPKYIDQLPPIRNQLKIKVVGKPGEIRKADRVEDTGYGFSGDKGCITIGDSRQGWTTAYQRILELASATFLEEGRVISLTVDVSNVRPKGEPLKGFGGISNPDTLPAMFPKLERILNGAVGRKLTATECCLLIDEAASVVVAGSIRRSAGMRQGASDDQEFAVAKDNLWQQDSEGNWKIDPVRDALRMANHTRVYHHVPTLEEVTAAVTKQFYSGEGAIQYAPEAIARANADLLQLAVDKGDCRDIDHAKCNFVDMYLNGCGKDFIRNYQPDISEKELEHRLGRYGLNPCGEILLKDNFCNLAEIHLNQLDPHNLQEQEEAFKVGALSVAALLHHRFTVDRYQYSRKVDPIVGVSFTGLFDFFVKLFGVDWLKWWEAGRPDNWEVRTSPIPDPYYLPSFFRQKEQEYLTHWRKIVHTAVWEYCDRHGLKRPNRCTTVQPAGSKSLLTGASSGWHPPKAQRYIRRMTFRRDDPIALAALDYGYSIVPSPDDKDDEGNLLNDIYDPRCNTWLVEVPYQVSWADLPGADSIHLEKFSVAAQFDFYMQVQRHYTTHNTSATLEMTQEEIPELAGLIHDAITENKGYISAALLARFDAPFPRLPFERISKEEYDRMQAEVKARRKVDNFLEAYHQYAESQEEEGPADSACSSAICEMKDAKPGFKGFAPI